MNVRSLMLEMKKVPAVAKRKRHVLIVVRDSHKKYILGCKKVYPEGIYRFVGGGVEELETFEQAATRELYEELRVYMPSKDMQELLAVIAHITDEEGKKYFFTTQIYFANIGTAPILPSTDLDGIQRLSEAQLYKLIHRYFHLPTQIDPKFHFSWHDYGKLYGEIHRAALEEIKRLGL